MLRLVNGCSTSEPTVTPKNWKTSNKTINRDWFIQYYFKDPNYSDKYPNGKQNSNKHATIKERRKITNHLLLEIKKTLINDDYNPFLKEFQNVINEINPHSSFKSALNFAFKNFKGEKELKLI